MTDEFTDESDGDHLAVKKSSVRDATLSDISQNIADRQRPYLELIELFHKLFWELPEITTKDVDARLQSMFDKLMESAATVGISRLSVPSLKECCGKKRIWTDPLNQAQVNLTPVVDSGGLGDFFKKVFSFLGFKPCAGCEQRLRWLNKIRWPWQRKGLGGR